MKKLTLLLLALLSSMLLFASCGTGGDNIDPPDDGGDDPTPDSATEYVALIRGENAPTLGDVVTVIYEKSGKTLSVMNDGYDKMKGEIVFGDADRAVTEEARTALDARLDASEADDPVGYVIYKAKDGSVAILWSDDYIAAEALGAFTANYANLALLGEMLPGVLTGKDFSLSEYEYEKTWGALEAVAPSEVFEALKSLRAYVNGPAIADWMANLWEPFICTCGKCDPGSDEISCYGGAFYYANSARDYVGFLPDLESTRQVLAWLLANGALTTLKDIPRSVSDRIVQFCQACLDPDDGYFYHPQWGKNIGSSRKGRDYNWGLELLGHFGATPRYPTAEERMNGKTSASLTAPLGMSAAQAVSAVVATASFDDSLASEEAYMKWLQETTNGDNMFKNSAGAHTIESVRTQIVAAGYLDITLDYLDAQQKKLFDEQKAAYDKDPENNPEPTGVWQRGIDYNAVWGLYKLQSLYSLGGREIQYAEYAIRTCVKCILIDADEGGGYHMNDVMNQWTAVSTLLANVKKHNPGLLPKLYEITNENAVAMINESKAKLEKFIQDDGTYGYNQGTSAPTTQGVAVSLGLPEGDVNATLLASTMYRSVYTVLGYDVVHLCDYRDGARFIEIISDLPSASTSKQPIPNAEPQGFDGGDMTGVRAEFNSAGGVEVVADPRDPSGSVLKVVNQAGANDGLYIDSTGSMSNKCLVFEADIMFESVTGASYFTQLYFGYIVYMMDFVYEGGKIILRDNTSNAGTGTTKRLNFTAELGEWFNLKIEFYPNEEDPKNPTIKIYKNGELTDTTKNFYGSHNANKNPQTSFSYVRFWSMKAGACVMYVDNVKASRENLVLTN